jgi:hypothetical protein
MDVYEPDEAVEPPYASMPSPAILDKDEEAQVDDPISEMLVSAEKEQPDDKVSEVSPPPTASVKVKPKPRENDAPLSLQVRIERGGDPERDKRVLQHVYGTLISCPGHDSFSLVVVEDGREIELEFPNETTHYSSNLVDKLKFIIGYDAVQVVQPQEG